MVHISLPPPGKKYYPLEGQRQVKEYRGLFSFHTICFTLLLIISIVTLSLCLSLVSKFNQWNLTDEQSNGRQLLNPSYKFSSNNSDTEGRNDKDEPSTHIRKPDVSHTPGFKEAARYLTARIDTSVDPCDDFYKYTCGNFQKNNLTNAFAFIQREDDDVLIEELGKVSAEDLKALRQARWVYDACLTTNSSKFTGSEVLQVIAGFEKAAGIIFPLLNPTKSVPELTKVQLAKSFALMSNIMGVSSLMNAETETNWMDPSGENPFRLYLDQASLTFDTAFYANGTFDKKKNSLKKSMTAAIMKVAKAAGIKVDNKTLDKDIEDMIAMEMLIGSTMNLPQDARRKFMPEWNPVTLRDAQKRWPFIDWKVYLEDLAMDIPDVQEMFHDDDFEMICKTPRFFDRFSDAIIKKDISQRTLQNYLMYRLISRQSSFINPPKTKQPNMMSNGIVHPSTIQQYLNGMSNYSCVSMVNGFMPFATGRLFIEAYTDAVRNKITEKMTEMIDNVILGFQSMVDGLPWMNEQVKQAVRRKIKLLQKNVIAPEWITDDALIDKYYENLDIHDSDSFFIMKMKLARFAHRKGLETLLTTKQDRGAIPWYTSAATVNAWYQASVNAINLPMSILRVPFFDPEWPIAINYGGLGSIMGHEMTHGFDDGGVQWDGIGKLDPWMTENKTLEGFTRMRKCIVGQYDEICPLPASYAPNNCVNGFQTQGENIADNGGIHAAYRAYRNLINLSGPEKRLPGDLMSQYTHDQLFFLGFASVWCGPEQSDAALLNQILTDPHSPDRFRVSGTLKNFPAFQQAFNCPVDSPMSPKKHCNVWVGDNKNHDIN